MPVDDMADEGVDFVEMLRTVLDYRKGILTTVAVATLVAALFAFLSPKHYQANTLVAPVDRSGNAGRNGALASQLGGLVGLAGLSGNHDSGKDVAIATLTSRILIESMIREENLLPVLFHQDWDADRQVWTINDPTKVPTLLDGYELFMKKILKVNEDNKKGLVTITVNWTSPQLAAQWANDVVKRTNRQLRERAIKESEDNLAYLEQEVPKTSLVEMRQSIFSLVQSELEKSMVAKGNEEYAFKVVDPAVVPEHRSSPKRLMLLLLGFAAGCVAGVAGALLHHKLLTLQLIPGASEAKPRAA